jgi:hypothetical protein
MENDNVKQPYVQHKFESWSTMHGSYSQPDIVPNFYATDNMTNKFSIEDMKLNFTICQNMREANKNQVVKHKKAVAGSNKLLAKSTSQQNFIDYRRWPEILHERYNMENIRFSFNKYIININEPIDDENEEGYVKVSDIKKVVFSSFGDDVPEHITDKFVLLARKVMNEGNFVAFHLFYFIVSSLLLFFSFIYLLVFIRTFVVNIQNTK